MYRIAFLFAFALPFTACTVETDADENAVTVSTVTQEDL